MVDINGGRLKFKYDHVEDGLGSRLSEQSNFTIFTPLLSSWITPAGFLLGLNPRVYATLKPGSAQALRLYFSTVDEPVASTTYCFVTWNVFDQPAPSIRAVVNAATLQSFLSPGTLASIMGTYLTGPTLSTNYGAPANYPTEVASTKVLFNGVAAPLLYLSPNQINVIVPFSLAGQTSAQVSVQRFDKTSAVVTVPLRETSPGIFTAAQSGTGQGAIIQRGAGGQASYNSCDNPAASGTALEIYATGMGMWTPAPVSDVFLLGKTFTTYPVSVTIGGQAARVLYAGTMGASQSLWSVLQVNAVVPEGLSPGPQPVVLKIGANDNSEQKVTVCVQ